MRIHVLLRSICCGTLLCSLGTGAGAFELTPSPIERGRVEARYSLVTATGGDLGLLAAEGDFAGDGSAEARGPKLKSPAKALLLSLVLPGAGQWYYGSRIKPFVFVGVEGAVWGLHANYHSNAESLTDEFEAFNREHWSREDYTDYLTWTYGATDDDDVNPLDYPEITHHLPDTRTQQYYEMTGKYDQFSWGWDDAVLRDSGFALYNISNPPPRVFEPSNIPQSANRLKYEGMRNDANEEFDKASKMVLGAIANRLVSGVEAFFMTRHLNSKVTSTGDDDEGSSLWGQLRIRPSLKSTYHKRDTPYVSVTYKF